MSTVLFYLVIFVILPLFVLGFIILKEFGSPAFLVYLVAVFVLGRLAVFVLEKLSKAER